MNNREIKWEIKKVAPGMVKIEANPLGRMPTFDEFKQKARELLSNLNTNEDLLRDENRSQDLGDSLLLSKELKKLDRNQETKEIIHQVAFTYGDSTLTANSKTVNELVEKKETRKNRVNEFGANPDITEQVLEDFER